MTDPTRAALLALAERCEQASGPDRWLDAKIFAAMKGAGWHAAAPGYCVRGRTVNNAGQTTGCPPFTGDVGQAAHIVPAGWLWQAGNYPHPNAACFPADERYTTSGGEDDENQRPRTVTLALCAAALRARAEEAGDGD